jgi:hypothetical protein
MRRTHVCGQMKVIGSPPKTDDQHGAEIVAAACKTHCKVLSIRYLTERVVF